MFMAMNFQCLVRFSGQGFRGGFRHFACAFGIGMDAVREEFRFSVQRGIHVDHIHLEFLRELGVNGHLLLERGFVDAEVAFARNRNRAADEDAGLRGQVEERFHEIAVIALELRLMLPVLRLRIIRAEHDDHRVGLEIESLRVGFLVPIRMIALAEQRARADAEVADHKALAEESLQLGGVGHAFACPGTLRDAVADAGEAERGAVALQCERFGGVECGCKGSGEDGEEQLFHGSFS